MWQPVISGVGVGTVYALIALGMSTTYAVTRVVNLAQGGLVVLAGLGAYSLDHDLHPPVALTVVVVVLGAGMAGALTEFVVIRPAMRRGGPTVLVLVTVGLLQAMAGVALVGWGDVPYTMRPFTGTAPIRVGGVAIPTQTLYLAGCLAVCAAGVGLLMNRTMLGLRLRATALNPEAARLSGVSSTAVASFVFTLSGALAGLAGAMIVPLTFIRFDTMIPFAVNGFVAAALGGLDRPGGAIAGGLALGLLEAVFGRFTSGLTAEVFAIATFLAVLLVRPTGLAGGDDEPSTAPGLPALAARYRRRARGPMAWLARHSPRSGAPAHGSAGRRNRVGPRFPVLALAVLVLAAIPSVRPGWVGVLILTGVFYLVVLGLDVMTGYAGQLSLGQTVFLAVGGYGSALLGLRAHWPPVVCVVVAAMGAAVLAVVLGSMFLRLRGFYLALATLGLALVVQDLAVGLVSWTGGPSGLAGVPVLRLGPLAATSERSTYYLVAGLGIGGALFVRNVARSQTGRALSALAADSPAAEMLGIDVARYRTRALVVSAVFASVAGSVYGSYFRFIAPDMIGVLVAFNIVVMLGLGGARSVLGPFVGALVVELLPQLGQGVARAEPLIAGCVLIVVMSYLPLGLWGSLRLTADVVGRGDGTGAGTGGAATAEPAISMATTAERAGASADVTPA